MYIIIYLNTQLENCMIKNNVEIYHLLFSYKVKIIQHIFEIKN